MEQQCRVGDVCCGVNKNKKKELWKEADVNCHLTWEYPAHQCIHKPEGFLFVFRDDHEVACNEVHALKMKEHAVDRLE